MGVLRKVASVATLGAVSYYTDDERQVRHARRAAEADSRVGAAELEAARAQVRRSQAEVNLALVETARLRVDLDALHLRYQELERSTRRPTVEQTQRRASASSTRPG